MVDYYGNWTEEENYDTYPPEKWCAYDHMAVWIRQNGYKIKTTMENLINIIFMHYDGELEISGEEFTIKGCQEYVRDCGGLREFDYEV